MSQPFGKIMHACPQCGVPIESLPSDIGNTERCPGCRAKVVVPSESQSVRPLQIVLQQISPKMMQWQCPQCGNYNKIRTSSIGSQTQCKACRLTFPLRVTAYAGQPSSGGGCIIQALVVALFLGAAVVVAVIWTLALWQ
jgi:uncharacterized protein (DUF983 family)